MTEPSTRCVPRGTPIGGRSGHSPRIFALAMFHVERAFGLRRSVGGAEENDSPYSWGRAGQRVLHITSSRMCCFTWNINSCDDTSRSTWNDRSIRNLMRCFTWNVLFHAQDPLAFSNRRPTDGRTPSAPGIVEDFGVWKICELRSTWNVAPT